MLLVVATMAACESAEPDPVDVEEGEAVCYDGFDNDADDAVDCADSSCASLAPCCVGVGDPSCCESARPIYERDFSACTTTLGDCASEILFSGEPQPSLVDDAFAPSRSSFPSGGYLFEPFDPNGSNLRLRFEAAMASCAETCFSYIAFGIADQRPSPFFAFSELEIALLINPRTTEDDEGQVIYRGRRVATFPVDDTGFHTYAIDLGASGTISVVELRSSGETLRELLPPFSAELPDPAWLAVTGQQGVNGPDGDVAGRIRNIVVERGVCDMPQRAFSEPDAVIEPPRDEGVVSLEGMGRAQNAEGLEIVVVESATGFHVYQAESDGFYDAVGELGAVALAPEDLVGSDASRISDPWIVADEDAKAWQMYFTWWDDEDVGAIGQVTGTSDFGFGFNASSFATVVRGEDAFPSVSAPTVLENMMVVRASFASLSVLSMLERDGATWRPARGSLAESVIHRPPFGDSAFDDAEVDDPALVRHNGMLRLYYAGRRGARFSIGLLLSETGVGWLKPLGDEPVWRRPPDGFDRVSTFEPVPWVDDGRIVLLFVGHDGIRAAVGRAQSGSPLTWPSVDPYPVSSLP